MLFASIIFAGRDWLWPAVVVAALALLLILRGYLRSPAGTGLRITCATLKLMGIALLLACLLEPMWTGQRAKPGANAFAVVADNSQSLKIADAGGGEPRSQTLTKALTGTASAWRQQLAESFEVRNYLMDSRLQSTRDFAELNFEGHSSAIGGALKSLTDRFRNQPVAGILLFTDGNATDFAGELNQLPELPPVYPVMIGRDRPARDLAIVNSSVSQTAFEDAPVTVQIDVNASGFSNEDVVAQLSLVDEGTNRAAAIFTNLTQRVPQDSGKVVFRFQIRPDKLGVLFYRARVGTAAQLGKFDDPSVSGEATLSNNETMVVVDRGRGTHRILYVSGRPNWEYKFLQRAATADDQIQLVGLVRIAKREPKFDFRGRTGESSNPLFRGFGNQSKEEIERYDQPVLVRLNTRDEFELRGGFPKTVEDLFAYEAVIVDDLEAEFFTTDQMTMLQRFVSERGGGFLMLGGAESFRDGNYARTAVGDMLPVYLDGRADDLADREFRLNLTREGWLQPWVRLRSSEDDERKRLTAMPYFSTVNRVREFKPGAIVVASVTDGKRDHPALVTQRFGRGRTGAMLLGDFWQSGLGDEARMNDLLKAWRQVIRWLVSDVPGTTELRVEPDHDLTAAGAVKIRLQVRDNQFKPLDNAEASLKVTPVGMLLTGDNTNAPTPAVLRAEAVANEPGIYEASYIPRESGGYKIEATVVNEQQAQIGDVASGWTADLGGSELRSLQPNRALLEGLARKSGGEVIEIDDLDAFVRKLPSLKAPVTENWTRPLWHTPWVFLFAVGCLVSEWGLRRWKGLP